MFYKEFFFLSSFLLRKGLGLRSILYRATVTCEPVWHLPQGALLNLAQFVASPDWLLIYPQMWSKGLISQQMAHSGMVAKNTMQWTCGGLTLQIGCKRKMISHICLWCTGQLEERDTECTGSNLRKRKEHADYISERNTRQPCSYSDPG